VVVVGLAVIVAVAGAANAETSASANAFLDRFVGEWLGVGTANGAPIQEALLAESVLGGTFLLMLNREIGGGDFQADTYVGYDTEEDRHELYAFNNNTALGSSLPVRLMTGRRDGEVLVLQERPGRQSLRYTFEFLDADTFRFTKAFVTGRRVADPFVIQVFTRQP
jgi:hypothetical protein